MKFSHIADCHLGSYRDDRMKVLTIDAFNQAISKSIEEDVDFILISGDLFNTSIPPIDSLKVVALEFKKLIEHKIPVYIIPGSHDFSPSGKTMLDVLENAGLCINVVKGDITAEGKLSLKFTKDEKTGVLISGMIGKRGTLEKSFYESLDNKNLESADGFKIFMFHSAITELKPKKFENIDSAPLSYLPKGFNYYAGGHVHSISKFSSKELGGVIAYPGPLFPNSFSELEDLGNGGFYIFDSFHPELLKYIPIVTKNVEKIILDVNHSNPEEVFEIIKRQISEIDVNDKIVLLRIKGKLETGKSSDIDFKTILGDLYSRGAYFVMKNTSALVFDEFKETLINSNSIFDIEEKIIKEHLGQFKFSKLDFDRDKELAKSLEILELLDVEKQDGENQKDFESRVVENLGFLNRFDEEWNDDS